MANLIDFEVSKDIAEKVYEALEAVKGSGSIRKGTNEATKAIERGLAKLVVIAVDVSPIEVVMHIPMICKEKDVPVITVPSKQELGAACGIEVSTGAVAVVDEGKGKKQIDDIIKKIGELKK
ncbi:MAG: 50S ribosomal protein L7Ae [Candidatus Aenigmarchaeota archaeon]|nr:50S ribosomal protein L7Ae [Candidatus Aenigmarchaeota archaeon]